MKTVLVAALAILLLVPSALAAPPSAPGVCRQKPDHKFCGFVETFDDLARWSLSISNAPIDTSQGTLRISWQNPPEPGADSAATTLDSFFFNALQSVEWEVVVAPPRDHLVTEKVEFGFGETWVGYVNEWRIYPTLDNSAWEHHIFGLTANLRFQTTSFPRYFRIIHGAGWSYEYSEDGTNWTVAYSEPGHSWGDQQARLYIGMRAFSGVGELQVDNVKIVGG